MSRRKRQQSRHLKALASHELRLRRSAGVFRKRRTGRMIYYQIDDDHLRLLLEVLRAHMKHAL